MAVTINCLLISFYTYISLHVRVYGTSLLQKSSNILWRKYLQGQGSNEIWSGVTQSCIAFDNGSSGSVKWQISSKRNYIVPSHAREVDNGTCSKSNAGTDSSKLMGILEFHLLAKLDKTVHRAWAKRHSRR